MIIICFVLRLEGSSYPKVLRDIFSSQNPHSHHLHQVQVIPGGTHMMLPSFSLAVAAPSAASLPSSIVSPWQPPLQPLEAPQLRLLIPAGHQGTISTSTFVVLVLDTAGHSGLVLVTVPLLSLGVGLWLVQTKVVVTPPVKGLLYI